MIPVNEPLLEGNEKKYLMECIETQWISSEGPFISKFEEQFSRRVGRKYGVAVANGTAALDIAVAALGIREGDEVIIPTFTIISCATAVVRAGGKPVLVDCDIRTWNMDVSAIEAKITSKTKAVMAVHLYGLTVDMKAVQDLCVRYRLKLIEDAAQAIGQTCDGKPCGSFGELSTFSFYPNKHITTGEGGMIATDDLELAERCRKFRNLCFEKEKRFFHNEIGWNYRMTNLQAAVGLAQLERLDFFLEKKVWIGQFYNKAFEGLAGVQLPLAQTPQCKNLYWVYSLVIEEPSLGSAVEAMGKLQNLGIGTRPFFWPMHEQPVFQKMGWYTGEKYPVAEKIARYGFYIPSGLGLNESKMVQVCEAVRKLFEQ